MRVISLSLSLSLVQAHFIEFFFGEDGRRTILDKKAGREKEKIQVSSSTQTATSFST
jgi:hypothetical protein